MTGCWWGIVGYSLYVVGSFDWKVNQHSWVSINKEERDWFKYLMTFFLSLNPKHLKMQRYWIRRQWMRDCGRFSPEKNSQVSKKKVLLGAGVETWHEISEGRWGACDLLSSRALSAGRWPGVPSWHCPICQVISAALPLVSQKPQQSVISEMSITKGETPVSAATKWVSTISKVLFPHHQNHHHHLRSR